MTQPGEFATTTAHVPTARQAPLLADSLLRCLERYQAALLDYEEHSAAASLPDPEESVVRRQIDCADQVILARLSLFRCLIEHGWTPPDPAQGTFEQDVSISPRSTGTAAG